MKLEKYKRYKYDKIVEDLNMLRDYVWINYYRLTKDDVENNVLLNKLLDDICNRFTSIVVECTTIKEVNILYKLCKMDINDFRDRLKILTDHLRQ